MLDRMKYINSKGQVLQFGEPPYYINASDFRDYKWTYSADSQNAKIQSFSKGITTKKLPVVIKADGDCTQYKNELYNIIQYDVFYNSAGKLFIGNYYMEGFFYASTKSDFLKDESLATITLEFVSEDGTWKRIDTQEFRYSQDSGGGSTGEKWLTYPYTYPYDYMAGSDVIALNNTSAFECEFVMRIYGQVTNPVITIGSVDYAVNTTIYSNEFLEIDSRNKTVIRYKPDGTAIDEFNNRSRDSNIFNKIPPGNNTLRHNVTNGIDIELIDERGEPLWI